MKPTVLCCCFPVPQIPRGSTGVGCTLHYHFILFPPCLLLLGSTLPCEDVALEELEAQLSHASSWRQEQLLCGGALSWLCILICPQQPSPFPKNDQGNADRSSVLVLCSQGTCCSVKAALKPTSVITHFSGY